MASSDSEYQYFNDKWKQLSSAAAKAGISPAIQKQVYDLDLSRLNNGSTYQLSGSEALAAMQSAAGGKPVTEGTPQAFDAAKLPGYVGHDVQDFGVGILGLIKKGVNDAFHPADLGHEVSALWKNPAVLTDPVKALGDYVGTLPNLKSDISGQGARDLVSTLGKSPLLSAVVPGVADASKFVSQSGQFQGVKGAESLYEQPFTSTLDVLPIGEAVGTVGSRLARAGLDEGALDAAQTAGEYKPGDISDQANQARAASQGAIPGLVRRAAAENPGGLVSLAHRLISSAPWQDETIGTAITKKINSASSGQLGPITSGISRMIQGMVMEPVHGGLDELRSSGLMDFYQRHDLTTPKEQLDFSNLLTHYRPDWKTDPATQDALQLEPGEADKLEQAMEEYDARLQVQTTADLEKERIAIVDDPRTGRTQLRALTGDDGRVVSAFKVYSKSRVAALARLHDLERMSGTQLDLADPTPGVLAFLTRTLDPLRKFSIGEKPDELTTRRMFGNARAEAAQARAARAVDTNERAAAFADLTRSRVTRDEVLRAQRLLGRGNLIDSLLQRVQRGEWEPALKLAQRIERTLKTRYVAGHGELATLTPAVEQAVQFLKAWTKKSTQATFDRTKRATETFEKRLTKYPEAALQPRANEVFADKLLTHLDGADIDPETASALMDQVALGQWHGETFQDLIGPGEMRKIKNSMLKQLDTEVRAGLAPKFVYSTRAGEIGRLDSPFPSPDRVSTTRSMKSRQALNPAAVYEPIVGLLRKQVEDLQEDAMTEFFYGEDGFVKRFGQSFDDIAAQANMLVKEGSGVVDRKHLVDKWISDHYQAMNPRDFFPTSRQAGTGLAEPEIWVERGVHKALQANQKSMHAADDALSRAYRKGTNLFRFSLLNFSPRYQAHIWLGGTTLLMLRSDPFHVAGTIAPTIGLMAKDPESLIGILSDSKLMAPFRPVFEHLKQRSDVRYGELGTPASIAHGHRGEEDPTLLNDWNFNKGRKLGEWLNQAMASRKVNAGTEFANLGANMLRSMAYLIGKEKGGTEEAGVRFALKVYADMNGMTPLERTIIRYVMPFYGWTRHVLQYVATYPIDHPLRAAVISQMVNQEWQDWNTGLPQSMMYLMELGGTAPNGEATEIDVRQLDPLRSVVDVFTIGGFVSSLNPAIQTAAQAVFGINPETGGPEQLYPTMTLNSFTGGEQAGPPSSLASILGNGIGQYIPEASIVDHFTAMSSYTRWAKANNHQAYENQLYSALSFPWIPQKVNLRQQIAQSELANYNVARDAATAAMEDPDPNSDTWKSLLQYSYVPYEGWMVNPWALRSWAFDSAAKAGLWNGQTATIAPSNIVVAPEAPKI